MTGLGICSFALRTLALCSLLFATMSKLLLSHFTKERHEWFPLFLKIIALWLTKNDLFSKKKYVFPMFVTVFHSVYPFLCPKATCHSLQKSDVRDLLFSWVNAVLLFRLQKTSNLLKKPWATSQPWFLNQNRRYLAFSQLYPGQTTCKCIKFEKSLKLSHPIVYTLHKTLYSL